MLALYVDLLLTTMKFDMVVDLLDFSSKDTTNSILPFGKIESLVKSWSWVSPVGKLYGLTLILYKVSKYSMSTELPLSTK